MSVAVNVDDLQRISSSLYEKYPVKEGVYMLLVLAFASVVEYSRGIQKFSSNEKVQLTVRFIPILIDHLIATGKIDGNQGFSLKTKLEAVESEIPEIIRAFIYILWGYKHDDDKSKKHKSSRR